MAIDIALDDEEMQKRMQQVAPLAQIQAPPGAPVQPSTMDQAKAMGTKMVLEKGLEAGMTEATPLIEAGLAKGTSALTGAGMGAGVATAVPYIGAGLLAGKALGFFSQGGFVGPLAKVEYKSNGGEVYKLSYGGPISKGV
jgi:hypothetical protein